MTLFARTAAAPTHLERGGVNSPADGPEPKTAAARRSKRDMTAGHRALMRARPATAFNISRHVRGETSLALDDIGRAEVKTHRSLNIRITRNFRFSGRLRGGINSASASAERQKPQRQINRRQLPSCAARRVNRFDPRLTPVTASKYRSRSSSASLGERCERRSREGRAFQVRVTPTRAREPLFTNIRSTAGTRGIKLADGRRRLRGN